MINPNISLSISIIALLISVLSLLSVRYQARRLRVQDADPLLIALDSIIEKIENAKNVSTLQEISLQFVSVIDRAELVLMPSVRKKVHKLIYSLWDAVHEKEPYLIHGGGIPTPGGGWIRPYSKMNAFKAQVLEVRRMLNKKLMV